jgi:F0F1-type ATP synthase assembly protein I
MPTRIGFFLFAGLTLGAIIGDVLVDGAGYGAIVGGILGIVLGYMSDRRNEAKINKTDNED